jgi:uncharacterized membrane protein
MANPFNLMAILLAKHAQHVVLIHFPIGLFTVGVAFDLIAEWTKRPSLAEAAYYNLLVAAVSTVPVLLTGILAWQLALEGQRLKGTLLLHILFAGLASLLIWFAWWAHFHIRRSQQRLPRYRLPLELLGVVCLSLAGHLGGILSGVNS